MTRNRMPNDPPSPQAGVILPIALIVLVAMTLSALALIRSVNLTTLVSGNLAFRESAVLSAEHGTEVALQWLVLHSGDGGLYYNAEGYQATRKDPEENSTWDAFWNTTLKAQAAFLPGDVAGNYVSYVIHRLCNQVGKPSQETCSQPPVTTSTDGHVGDSEVSSESKQFYYRITTRVDGPHYTVVYTQTIIVI